jgi:CheY-like chemotaxis protein
MNDDAKRTVLIVEDELMVLWLAREEFADAGYRVLEASDGEAALEILEADPTVDLLFTDIRMPGSIDGWSLARAARQLRPDLPVIYATGFSAEEPQFVDGARLFSKPYRLSAVIGLANELVHQGTNNNSS